MSVIVQEPSAKLGLERIIKDVMHQAMMSAPTNVASIRCATISTADMGRQAAPGAIVPVYFGAEATALHRTYRLCF